MSATRPEHHFPGKGLNPAVPGIGDNTFAGATEPGLDGTTELDHQAGQPDTWPQRPDVPVEKSKEDEFLPTLS